MDDSVSTWREFHMRWFVNPIFQYAFMYAAMRKFRKSSRDLVTYVLLRVLLMDIHDIVSSEAVAFLSKDFTMLGVD